MVVSPIDRITDVADVWKGAGGVWHQGDYVHFEFPNWQNMVISQAAADPWYSKKMPKSLELVIRTFVPGADLVSALVEWFGVS